MALPTGTDGEARVEMDGLARVTVPNSSPHEVVTPMLAVASPLYAATHR